LLYIVYCIDAEGPVYESLDATFERVSEIFGVDVEPSQQNLIKLQKGDIPRISRKKRDAIMKMVSPDRLSLNADWSSIDKTISKVICPKVRNKLLDSYGNGYIYNWFCVDMVGFETNPRRRAFGYHQMYEYYKNKTIDAGHVQDRLYWHHHPVPFTRQGHKTANNISFTNHHIQVLCRRVIDCYDFPVAFRPGGDVVRPDISFFLEQWIPFDYSNHAVDETEVEKNQLDLAGGRFSDCRRSPKEWIVFHPDYFDYQKQGNMKRYVARCLYLRGRFKSLTEKEVDAAFARADSNKPTVMAFLSHDIRDMTEDINLVNKWIKKSATKHKDVKFKFANAVDAIREALSLKESLHTHNPPKFDIQWKGSCLKIISDKKLWGPQPFFCFQTWDFNYYHDNLDKDNDTSWSYVFDYNTIDIRAVKYIGIASNDDFGNTTVCVINMENRKIKTVYRNV